MNLRLAIIKYMMYLGLRIYDVMSVIKETMRPDGARRIECNAVRARVALARRARLPRGKKKNGTTLHSNGIVSRDSKAARHAVRNEV